MEEHELSEIDRLRAENAVHLKWKNELRKWWRFDNGQQHTHSWHDREDFIESWEHDLKSAGQPAPRKKRQTGAQ